MSHESLPSEPTRLWQRVREGLATAVFGRLPEPPAELHLLRVSCDVAPAELRPLIEARRRAEAILDEEQPLLDQARERVVSGLRRRLLGGDPGERATEAVLVEVWNHLAKQTGRSWALVLEAVEAADATTLATLAQIVRRPGWLQLPLVLVFRGEPEGPAARLLTALREHAGPESVLRGEAQQAPAPAVDWRTLPFEVLRVLRAGALVGPGFEADVVAALLAEPSGAVLERLQQAADLGVPIEDRGDGRFSLPGAELAAIAGSILPSLAQAWHRRLGGLLGGRSGEPEARRVEEPVPGAMGHETGAKGQANPVGLCGADVEEAEGPEDRPGAAAPGSGDSGVFAATPGEDGGAGQAKAEDSGVFARPGEEDGGQAKAEDSGVFARAAEPTRKPVMVVRDLPSAAPSARAGEPDAAVGRRSEQTEPLRRSVEPRLREASPRAEAPARGAEAEVFARRPTEAPATEPDAAEVFARRPTEAQVRAPVAEEPHAPSAPVAPGALEQAARAAEAELRAEREEQARRSGRVPESERRSADREERRVEHAVARAAAEEALRAAARAVTEEAPRRGTTGIDALRRPSGATDEVRGASTEDRWARAAEEMRAAQAAVRTASASTLPRPGSLRQVPKASGGARSDTGEVGEALGRGERMVDEVRAAEHLRLAGELDAAAERYCAAARAADEAGAPQAAAQHVRRALSVLASLPASPGRRRLRVRALIELGRLQWQWAGPELGSTLTEALATLEGARQELGPGDPVSLYSELCQAIAGVCFDLGDLRSLERSLEELSSASRALHAAGDATGAARLLNDQAAVYVRMGDPVRALHLLRESRQVFEAGSATDPVVLRELAETDRLFARIPLHAQLRPGREQDGYTMGLDHAIAAERAYRQLGDTRELARVWETMGRLELRKGRNERAAQRLQAALEVQMQIGDLTGLARTTEALSEVLAASGRDAEALTLLRDSVLFNREKGSPLGLAMCRRAFQALARRVATREELGPALHELAGLLDAAEGELGALRLPGEGD